MEVKKKLRRSRSGANGYGGLAGDRLSDAVFLQCNSVFEGRRRRMVLHVKRLDLRDFGGFVNHITQGSGRDNGRLGIVLCDGLLHRAASLLKFP